MQYYKHMSNMRNDVKIKRLISKYGLEGYGLYNLILESITEGLTTQSPIPDLQETCADIAEFYNADTTKINEMTCFMINQGLLEIDEISQRITCHKIYKYLEASQTRSEAIRDMIKNYRDNIKLLPEMSDTVTDIYEEKNRIEEKRTEKNKDSFSFYAEIEEIISYLNQKCNKHFTYKNASYNKHITGRLNDGFCVADFKKVIDAKLKDDYFQKNPAYYNPDTLFRPSNFEKYLNEWQDVPPVREIPVNPTYRDKVYD